MNHEPEVEISAAAIEEFLESAPLYSWRTYIKPRFNISFLPAKEVDSFCETCEQIRPFQVLGPSGGGSVAASDAIKSGTSYFRFTCVSCRSESRIYAIQQIVDDTTIKIQKYGQLPRQKLERNKSLQKFLSDDIENYEKAVVCLSHEYGVAAFAYFRRIVETNIGRLLDLVQQDAAASGADVSIAEAIVSLRTESPMSEKIKIANVALPSHLKPDGLNPLGRLYQVLSEGVHNSSDQECLAKARVVSECLAFLVSELASRKEHRARFKTMIGGL